MATKYNLVLADGSSQVYARKDAAIKHGEAADTSFQVLTTTGGTVVHEFKKPQPAKQAETRTRGEGRVGSQGAPKKAAPKPPTHDEDDEIAEEEEKPMTKSEAYAWFKRSREGLRDAERAIERGDGKSGDLAEALNDAQGAIVVLLDALANLGINGVA